MIQILIDEKQTNLKDLLKLIEKSFDFSSSKKIHNNNNEIVLKLKSNTYLIEEIWSHNMYKCVDAAPVLSNLIFIEKVNLRLVNNKTF